MVDQVVPRAELAATLGRLLRLLRNPHPEQVSATPPAPPPALPIAAEGNGE